MSVDEIRACCNTQLKALGPKPSWWRFRARREWRDAVNEVALWAFKATFDTLLPAAFRRGGYDRAPWQIQQGQWQGLRVVKDEEVN